MTIQPQDPVRRIRIIEASLRCFVLSWFSLIPLIGLFLGLLALSSCASARRNSRGEWNPAQHYLIAGFLVSGAGIILSLFALGFCALLFLKSQGLA
ncbi:MAG: hypothetical protein JWM99_131 [Verrucomicrobiales bacterium]|jgi:hypothetical protein|nr:hypothetical protein [Verrucomicrobiales bacterium]